MPNYEAILALLGDLYTQVRQQAALIEQQAATIAELRNNGKDS